MMSKNTAAPIGIKMTSQDNISAKYSDRRRVGKTAKDKKSGANHSRYANRDARVAWQKDNRATNDTFPG
jgi:hypothetical protein